MDSKVIRENVGRVKAYSIKGESMRSLHAAISAFKEVVNVPAANIPTSVRSCLRELIQLLVSDELIVSKAKKPLAYQPGQEKLLCAILVDVYKQLVQEQNSEVRSQAKDRKLRLDKAYNVGLKLLALNKVTEAEQAFQESVACYKDENMLFMMIAEALVNAGQFKRALPYAKKASELLPDPQNALALIAKINKELEKANQEKQDSLMAQHIVT